jgi:hypothetical protein
VCTEPKLRHAVFVSAVGATGVGLNIQGARVGIKIEWTGADPDRSYGPAILNGVSRGNHTGATPSGAHAA